MSNKSPEDEVRTDGERTADVKADFLPVQGPNQLMTLSAEFDRELLERGQSIILKFTDQLEWQHKLTNSPQPPNGDVEKIIWGWLMEAEVLLRKLHALMEEMVEEKKIPEVAVLEAHIAIRHAVNNLRPDVVMVPNFLAAPMGARAELGQAYVACGHMVQGLAQLLQGSGGSGNSFPMRVVG